MKQDRKISPMILVKHSDDEDREGAIDNQIRILLARYIVTRKLPVKNQIDIRRQVLFAANPRSVRDKG